MDIVEFHHWPTDGLPFMGIGIRASELASRTGMPLRNWEVPGLGPATGFGFRTKCGRVYLLQELESHIKHYGGRGPAVHADATDICTMGVAALVADVAEALGLATAEMRTSDNADLERMASEVVAAPAKPRAVLSSDAAAATSERTISRDLTSPLVSAGNSPTERIFGRILMWAGIALAIAEFCMLVLDSPYELWVLMNRLFYSCGLMIGLGAWAAAQEKRSVWRAIVLGGLLQLALLGLRHLARLAISYW